MPGICCNAPDMPRVIYGADMARCNEAWCTANNLSSLQSEVSRKAFSSPGSYVECAYIQKSLSVLWVSHRAEGLPFSQNRVRIHMLRTPLVQTSSPFYFSVRRLIYFPSHKPNSLRREAEGVPRNCHRSLLLPNPPKKYLPMISYREALSNPHGLHLSPATPCILQYHIHINHTMFYANEVLGLLPTSPPHLAVNSFPALRSPGPWVRHRMRSALYMGKEEAARGPLLLRCVLDLIALD